MVNTLTKKDFYCFWQGCGARNATQKTQTANWRGVPSIFDLQGAPVLADGLTSGIAELNNGAASSQ